MSDPATPLEGLRQPDQLSCGASALVAARMLADPAYGAAMSPELFAHDVLATHRLVTGSTDVTGRRQAPWPRRLGTPPWAVARYLSTLTPPGAAPVRYVSRLAWPRAGGAFDRARSAVASGRPVALYVGNRWLPRHVVLAVATGHDPGPSPHRSPQPTLRVYDPATGLVVDVTRASVVEHRVPLSWCDRLWFVVLPTG